MRTIFNRSRQLTTNVVDGKTELDMGSQISFPATSFDFFMIKPNEDGRPDIFSFRVYGDQKYWWLICSYNGIMDPQNQFVHPLILKVPPVNYFNSYCKSNAR